jgi:hypothetical protein
VNITLAEKRKEFKTTSDKARIDDYVRNSCVFNDDEYKDEECINRNGLKPRDKSKINSYLLADEGIDLNCAERSTSTDYERSNIHSSINEYSDELESEHVKIFRRVNKPLAPRVEAENFNELDDFISNETTTETNTFDANTLTIVTPQRTNSNLFNRNFNNIKNLIFKRLPAKSRLESQISSTTTSSYLSSSTYTPQTPTDSLTKQNSNYEEQQSLLPSTSYSESSSIPTRSHSSSSYNSTFNNSFESNSKDQTNKVQKRESKANSGN